LGLGRFQCRIAANLSLDGLLETGDKTTVIGDGSGTANTNRRTRVRRRKTARAGDGNFMNRLLRFAVLCTLALCATSAFASRVGVTTAPTLDIWWDNPADGSPMSLAGTVGFEVDENGDFVADAQTFTWGSGEQQDTIYLFGLDGNVDPFVNFAVGVISIAARRAFSPLCSACPLRRSLVS
jgi:hypothetical protein